MDETQATPESGATSGWGAVLRNPRVWIPAAAAVTVIAVSVGLIATTAARRDDAVAAVGASSGPTPSASATASAGDPDVVVAAEGSPTPSPSPSVSASTDPTEDEDAFVPMGDDDLTMPAAEPCVPVPAAVTPVARQEGVLPTASGATTTVVEPRPTQDLSAFLDPEFSADGTRLAMEESGEGRSTVRLSDTATMETVAALVSDDDAAFAWDPSGTRLATARVVDDALLVEIVDPASGDATVLTELYYREPQALAWSTDGSCLALSSRSAAVSNDDERRVRAHWIAVIGVSDGEVSWIAPGASPVFAPDGGLLYRSGEESGPARLTRALPGSDEQVGLGAGSGLGNGELLYRAGLAPSPDHTRIAYLDRDDDGLRTLRVAATDGSSDREVATLGTSSASTIVWSPDGSTVMVKRFVGSRDTELVLVDVASAIATVLEVPLETGEWIWGASFTADGSGVLVSVNKWRKPGESNASRMVLVSDEGAAQVGDKQRGWAHSAPTWSPTGDVLVMSAGQILTRDLELDGSLVVTRR
ncbi:WD40 repeat domain-containing protein [Demequina rhizosphaerae]|uniref:WD40 repeat domain-containing protein n=1 Tax=Demequina rhizosphaerae TaxID=1638985 RepID=UPI000A3EA7C5|nr:WD40 repeat domain-containing protein [Demequina rhizosphaerae]